MPTTAKKIVRRRPKPRAREAPARCLSPSELIKLVRKARDAKSPAEAKRLEDEVIRRFYGAEPRKRQRAMTPAELEQTAREMVAAAEKDPAEANRLQERLVRGFYGDGE